MPERPGVVPLQHGIWIDQQQLLAAGLRVPLEVDVQPGEIRIRSASRQDSRAAEAAADVERGYPLIDESFREGWESPGMEDYDRYDELRKA